MKYYEKCLMPDTIPGIVFENGVCSHYINYEKFEVSIGTIKP